MLRRDCRIVAMSLKGPTGNRCQCSRRCAIQAAKARDDLPLGMLDCLGTSSKD
jgi:hypothetical protein